MLKNVTALTFADYQFCKDKWVEGDFKEDFEEASIRTLMIFSG